MKRRIILVVMTITLGLVLAACGDGGADSDGGAGSTVGDDAASEPPSESSSTGTEADLEQAAVGAFAVFQSADDQAYFDIFSRECRETLGFPAIESYLDGRRFNIDLGGIDLNTLSAGEVTIDDFDGSSADVSLEIEGTTERFRENLPTEWLYEEGAWRIADCSDIRPAANDLSAEGTDPDDALEYGFIADLEGWLINQTWANLDDEEIVVEFGGDPAPDGSRLVTTGVGLTYTGPESSIRLTDELAFALVNGSTVYGEEASCETEGYGTAPVAAEPIVPGDSLAPAVVCRVVPESDLEGLLLRVTHVPTGGERWFRMDQT
jgi:hypothetical protein